MKIRYLLSMSYFNYLYENGLKVVCDKKVVFCGMVRDCAKELNHNITTIEKIGSYFSDYRIVIFENNSKDDTKLVLTRWMSNNKRVNAIVNDFDETKYQQIPKDPSYYLPNCRRRIHKYVDYRNMYMVYLDQMDFESKLQSFLESAMTDFTEQLRCVDRTSCYCGWTIQDRHWQHSGCWSTGDEGHTSLRDMGRCTRKKIKDRFNNESDMRKHLERWGGSLILIEVRREVAA